MHLLPGAELDKTSIIVPEENDKPGRGENADCTLGAGVVQWNQEIVPTAGADIKEVSL